jgi:hypothetical protein
MVLLLLLRNQTPTRIHEPLLVKLLWLGVAYFSTLRLTQLFPENIWYPSNNLQGATSQKVVIFVRCCVRKVKLVVEVVASWVIRQGSACLADHSHVAQRNYIWPRTRAHMVEFFKSVHSVSDIVVHECNRDV